MRAIYSFNWNRFVQLILPPFLRTQAMVDWLLALLAGIRKVKADSIELHASNLARAKWNSGRLVMEKLMNDLFDPELRNIRVLNTASLVLPFYTEYRTEGQPPDYVFSRSESAQPTYRKFRSELNNNQPDATFELPWYTDTINARIIKFIELVLFAGVTYTTITTYPNIPSGTNAPTYE